MDGKLLLAAAIAAFTLGLPAIAADEETPEDWIMDTSGIGQSNNGVVRNDQFLELGVPTASALQLEGESAMRLGNLDRALTVLQRSIELAPLDSDKRILYAEALEKKLMMQKERDPRLYNFLVKQWLFVAQKADFPDQQMTGRAHLANMTGQVPKNFEKPHKFLARVLVPEDGSQKVVIGGERRKTKLAEKPAKKDEME